MQAESQTQSQTQALNALRQEWRKTILQARRAMAPDARANADAALDAQLRARLGTLDVAILAFYWPIQAEFDARPAVAAWLDRGAGRRAVLPVVTAKHQPLSFRQWTSATVMQPAGFGTSVPSAGEWLTPTVLLIPLVGFDSAGYRLGYGGGYYDRTLAALNLQAQPRPRTQPRPQTIGIGYASGRLDTIQPQAHDIRLDAVLSA